MASSTTTSNTALSGLSTLTSAQNKGTDSASSKTKLFDDMEAFMYLLTQQLKNQDPLDPMDTSEYTQQLVQYAQVEQQIQTNSYLETVVAQNVNSMATQAVNYMDQTVQALSSSLPLQDGYAKFSYTLSSDAVSCVAAIKDSEGNFVKTFTGTELSSGRHVLEWDGKDNSGIQLADGAYQVVVTATDSTGKAVTTQTTVYGKVTGVAYDGENVYVGMGDTAVDMNTILAIHSADEMKHPTSDSATEAAAA